MMYESYEVFSYCFRKTLKQNQIMCVYQQLFQVNLLMSKHSLNKLSILFYTNTYSNNNIQQFSTQSVHIIKQQLYYTQ